MIMRQKDVRGMLTSRLSMVAHSDDGNSLRQLNGEVTAIKYCEFRRRLDNE
jgi:hypothetical protein